MDITRSIPGQYLNQTDYILCCWRWKSSIQSAKTRLGADCGSDHELLTAKFRLKLKEAGKTTRPFRYHLNQIPYDYTVQFSSVAQSCPTMTAWTAAHQASLSITNSWSLLRLMSIESMMPSNHHPLSSPSPPAFDLSQHQGLFQWVSSLHQVAKALEFQLQHQSFQWIFRTDFL